ncbi:MAG: beta-eliminating lyase-related protein, partial [Myxococcaceae bacterium]
SALCGSRELIREARRLRKRLGGGMRQVGVLAAAALWALEHNVQRLEEDHRSARRLAEGLAELPGVELDLDRVKTNMVFVRFPVTAVEAVSRLRELGVLANPEGSDAWTVRMVTHHDAPMAQIEEALERIQKRGQ